MAREVIGAIRRGDAAGGAAWVSDKEAPVPDRMARVTAVSGPVLELACDGCLPAVHNAVIVDPDGAAMTCAVQPI